MLIRIALTITLLCTGYVLGTCLNMEVEMYGGSITSKFDRVQRSINHLAYNVSEQLELYRNK